MVTPNSIATAECVCNTIATVGATLAPWSRDAWVRVMDRSPIRYNGSSIGSTVHASAYVSWKRGCSYVDAFKLTCKQRRASYTVMIPLSPVIPLRELEPIGAIW